MGPCCSQGVGKDVGLLPPVPTLSLPIGKMGSAWASHLGLLHGEEETFCRCKLQPHFLGSSPP